MDICYKNLNYLLNLLINCISARSALEILSIEATWRWYPSYFGFLAGSNALSRYTLSAAVLLFKSLKSP